MICGVLGEGVHWVVYLQLVVLNNIIHITLFCRDDPAILILMSVATGSSPGKVAFDNDGFSMGGSFRRIWFHPQLIPDARRPN